MTKMEEILNEILLKAGSKGFSLAKDIVQVEERMEVYTLSLVQDWLRKEKLIEVSVSLCPVALNFPEYTYKLDFLHKETKQVEINNDSLFEMSDLGTYKVWQIDHEHAPLVNDVEYSTPSYTECLRKGIEHALNKI